MARLTEYDYNLCVEICDLISMGFNVKEALSQEEKYPTFQTWCNWKRQHKELFDLYINAIQDKAEILEQEMDEYRDMLLQKEIDPATYNTLVQTLKWKMAKFYPKMFGEKQQIDHTTAGKEININPVWKFIDAEKK